MERADSLCLATATDVGGTRVIVADMSAARLAAQRCLIGHTEHALGSHQIDAIDSGPAV